MAHVVTDRCIRCRFTDCVDVCPVDCFHAHPEILVIDPQECIDCGVCVPACPVEAIFLDEDVPSDQQMFIALNADFAQRYPIIFAPTSAHPLAEESRNLIGKTLTPTSNKGYM